MRPQLLALTALLCCLLVGCVGKKTYREALYLVEQGERRERQLRAQLEYADRQTQILTERNGNLDQIIGVLRQERSNLESDTLRLGRQLRSMRDRSRMTQQELGTALEQCQEALRAVEARLAAIDQAVARRDDRLRAAYEAMRDSLSGLNPAEPATGAPVAPGNAPPPEAAAPGAEAVFRDGKITVSLPDPLLFAGSNFRISEAGMEALRLVASVCNQYPDLEVLVLGHTSNRAAPPGFIDNWGLSARRAAAVVRTLVGVFNVSANQLTAAGKGEYRPRVANDSPEGQTVNRRLELILSPRLDMLYRDILRSEP